MRRLLYALAVVILPGSYALGCLWVMLFFITDLTGRSFLQMPVFVILALLCLMRIFLTQYRLNPLRTP